jgi:hypothetical protein
MQVNNTCIEVHITNTCMQVRIFKFFSKTCEILRDSDVCWYLYALIFHVHVRHDSRGNAKVSAATTSKMIRPSPNPACQCKKILSTKTNSEAILHWHAKFDYIVVYMLLHARIVCFSSTYIYLFLVKLESLFYNHTILAQKTCSLFQILDNY